MKNIENQATKEVQSPELLRTEVLEAFKNNQALQTLLSACKTAKKKGKDITIYLDKYLQK